MIEFDFLLYIYICIYQLINKQKKSSNDRKNRKINDYCLYYPPTPSPTFIVIQPNFK